MPKPPQSKPIWDPTDPFIVEYQRTHPHVEAAWRSGRAPTMVALDIETRDGI